MASHTQKKLQDEILPKEQYFNINRIMVPTTVITDIFACSCGHCPQNSFYCMLYRNMKTEIYVYLYNKDISILEKKERAK